MKNTKIITADSSCPEYEEFNEVGNKILSDLLKETDTKEKNQ